MNIRQVEYFCKVCEYKRLAAAARELYISEQALSKSIASMERELGFDLFLRTSKGLELTTAGVAIYEKAIEAVMAMKELRSSALTIQDGQDKQRVQLGFYEGFLGGENDPFPVRLLVKFAREHAGCSLGIFEGPNEQVYHRTAKGVLDLGVFVGEVPPNCEGIKLVVINLGAVISRKNPLSRKKSLEWKDLDGQKLMQIRGKNSMQEDISRICEKVGAKPLSGNVIASSQVALQFVYENEGILLLDRKYERTLDKRKAVLLPIQSNAGLVNPSVSVIWREGFELSPVHKRLVNCFRERVNLRSGEVKDSFTTSE